MTTDLAEIASTVIKTAGDRRILISDVATIGLGVQTMRGDASIGRYRLGGIGPTAWRISGSAGRQACGLRIRNRGFGRIRHGCCVR